MPHIPEMNDQELLAALRAGGREFDRACEYIYKRWRGLWMKEILSAGGTKEEAEEANSEAFVPFIKRVIKSDFFPKKASLKTYYTRCVVYQWLKMKGRAPKFDPEMLPMESLTETVEEEMEKKEMKDKMDKLLNLLGDRCKKVLTLWSLGYSMEEIAKEVQIPGGAAKAKQAKYECLKKLIDLAGNDPDLGQI